MPHKVGGIESDTPSSRIAMSVNQAIDAFMTELDAYIEAKIRQRTTTDLREQAKFATAEQGARTRLSSRMRVLAQELKP